MPVVVGGTGLYFKTLLDGIAPVPDIPDDVRQDVRQRMAAQGPQALYQELTRHDAHGASKLAPNDRQRIARALEVVLATGKSLGHWQSQPHQGGLLNAPDAINAITMVLAPDRAALYQRCNQRFDHMVRHMGALDEAAALMDNMADLPADAPILRALGLAECRRHLAGGN